MELEGSRDATLAWNSVLGGWEHITEWSITARKMS